MSFCQAGEERFLRIILISKKPPVEKRRIKLSSCRDNIEMASPGIEWLPESSILRINWLQGPDTNGVSEERVLQIDDNGNVH